MNRFWCALWLVWCGCAARTVAPPSEPKLVLADPSCRAEAWLEALRGPPAPLDTSGSLRARVAEAPPEGSKGDIRDVYRKTAPATVLIKSRSGFGSGAVIDARGFILTNHHVIADGEPVDFKRRVTVELGALSPQGVMEKVDGELTAWVLKSDPLLDLAVLKLESPPPGLVALTVAASDPVPGEPVSALGNGGIGLLWAIKDGEISSIGRLATHLAHLVGAECATAADPLLVQQCKSSRASIETERKSMAEQVPGLVIQSSCPISPGDSGGPLVNRAGELVGLNAFLRTDPSAPVTANFHVHVAEIRQFLEQVPSQPVAQLPDPFDIARKGTATLDDVDRDGMAESVLVGGLKGLTLFIDATQAQRLSPNENALNLIRGRSFRARLVLMKDGGSLTSFVDADGDGRFERLVTESAPGSGKGIAWALDASGTPKRGVEEPLLDPRQLEGAAATRLGMVLRSYRGRLGLTLPDPPLDRPPDALLAASPQGRLYDADRDGRFDTALTSSLDALVLMLDPVQRQLPMLTPESLAEALQKKVVSPRASFVQQGSALWAFFDTDTTPGFDLLLASSDTRTGAATAAWDLKSGGALGEARPDLVGSLVGRSDLFTAHTADRARAQQTMATYASRWRWSEKIPGGIPHPLYDVGTDVLAEPSGVKGFENAVVSIVGDQTSSLVFELDQNSQQSPAQIAAHVRQGAAGADFAWVKRGDFEWFLYDSKHAGLFDVVLFRPDRKTVHGLRRGPLGVWQYDAALGAGTLVRPSLLADKPRQDALAALAKVFFTAEVLPK